RCGDLLQVRALDLSSVSPADQSSAAAKVHRAAVRGFGYEKTLRKAAARTVPGLYRAIRISPCGATPPAMGSPLQRHGAARADHIRSYPEADAGIGNHGEIRGVEKEPGHAGPECVTALEIAIPGGDGNSAPRLQVCGAAQGESDGGAGARLAIVVD